MWCTLKTKKYYSQSQGLWSTMHLVAFWTVFYGFLINVQLASTQATCGTLGTNCSHMSDSGVAQSVQLFVLNTLKPATSSGTISSYRYCFSSLSNEPNSNLSTCVFALYRNKGDSYSRVSDPITIFCSNITTKQSCLMADFPSPISVTKGDIFGACINVSSENAAQVSLVGNDTGPNTEAYLLTASIDFCNGSVPFSIHKENVATTKGLVLHLSALVSMNTTLYSELEVNEIVGISVPLVALLFIALLLIIIYWSCRAKLYGNPATQPLLIGIHNRTYGVSQGQQHLPISNTPPLSENSDSDSEDDTSMPSYNSSEPPFEDTRIDSGSYNEVRSTPVRERVDTSRVSQTEGRVYELECSTVPKCSFVCSYENVSHYEPMAPRVEEFLVPVQDFKKPVTITQLLEMNKEEDIYSTVSPFKQPPSIENDLISQLKSCQIEMLTRETIDILGDIGIGHFGTVKEGVWREESGKSTRVALKSIKQDCDSKDRVKFLQEAAITAQFRHPNIIQLYGVVVESQQMMLVVEFAAKGDLRKHLISLRPGPTEILPEELSKTILAFSQQVALGMQYLSAKGFVHRDIAARNILLSKNDVCKVADFGMSCVLMDEKYYVSQERRKIPVKWTAPEALHYKKYSIASDVWAYGCLLYEIWSMGHKPFESLTNIQTLRALEDNKRLPPPPGCPEIIYDLMIRCWHPETSQRPSFRDIVLTLARDEEVVLSIPEEDSSTHPLGGVLGAQLEAGENMYYQTQIRYCTN